MATVKKAYIDSNVFIAAAIDDAGQGERSRDVLKDISEGRIEAFSSVLSLDELYYKVLKARSRENADLACQSLMLLRNLQLVDASREIVSSALDTLKGSKLLPRDAIHLATMRSVGISLIISEDSDFDGVHGIRRLPP